MRGQWQSGTRKLNRHYQSGGGEGSFTIVSKRAIAGISPEIDMNIYPPHFPSYDADNVSVVQFYKLWGALSWPIQKSVEFKNVVYGQWYYIDIPTEKHPDRSNGYTENVPVISYGEIIPEPCYAYFNFCKDNGSIVVGHRQIRLEASVDINPGQPSGSQHYNQDNITLVDTQGDVLTDGVFEQKYSGKSINVILPIFDLIAIPIWRSGTPPLRSIDWMFWGAAITDEGLNFSYTPKIKYKGFNKSEFKQVPSFKYYSGYSALGVGIYRGQSDDIYYNAGGFDSLGGLGVYAKPDSYLSANGLGIDDTLYTPLYEMNDYFVKFEQNAGSYADKIRALSPGTYTDPETGTEYDMIYMVRFVRIEKTEIQPSLSVIPETVY